MTLTSTDFLYDKHLKYLSDYVFGDGEKADIVQNVNTMDYFMTVHLRLGGAYWSISAL